MVRGGKSKPQRGLARRFTSSRDPEAYVHGPSKANADSDSESGSGSEEFQDSPNKVAEKLGKMNVSKAVADTSDSDSSSDDSEDGSAAVATTSSTKPQLPSAAGRSRAPAAPRELSRKEREAIEKEQARQHFLKMKEKEDAARLAVIRKRREEEAAAHAAELKGFFALVVIVSSLCSQGRGQIYSALTHIPTIA